MKSTFKISQKIKEAWPLYKQNLALFFLMFACLFIEQIIYSKESFVLRLISILIGIFISYMTIRFLLSIIDKKEFNPFSKNSLPSTVQLWNFLKTYILFVLISFVGLFIFLIPAILILPTLVVTAGIVSGFTISSLLILFISFVIFIIIEIYISTRLSFSCFISVEKNQGAIKSIRESWGITKGNFWNIFGKMLVIGLFAVSGFIGLIVGIFITYPIAMILGAMLYKNFQKNKEDDVTIVENIIEETKEIKEIEVKS